MDFLEALARIAGGGSLGSSTLVDAMRSKVIEKLPALMSVFRLL